MNIQTRFLAIAVAASFALITACGGGDDINDNSSSSSGDGNTSAAQIDSTNGKNLAVNAYDKAFFIRDLGGLTSLAPAVNGAPKSASSTSMITQLRGAIANKTTELDITCTGGGTLQIIFDDLVPEDMPSAGDSFTVTARNCIEGPDTLNGVFSFVIDSVNEGSGSFTFSFTNFSVISGADTDTANGSMTIAFSNNGLTETTSITIVSLTVTSNSEMFSLTNYSAVVTVTGSAYTYDADYMLASPQGQITVITDPAFQGISNLCPTVGTMTISASDGSLAILNADTGDPNTMLLTINDGAATTTETVNCNELNS
ncbi:MAG: hypothetical protein GY807_03190 [Gammaproteobacteria bacterium]|nr:hypothetical protein [Gammaproteobacteria bacterium]